MQTSNNPVAGNVYLAVIDDDENACTALQGLLSAQGYRAEFFHNPETFINAGADNFNCILLELWFKNGMNGLEVQRHLHEKACKTPVIIITALGDVETAFEAGRQGASAFLAKPLCSMQLWTVLQQTLSLKKSPDFISSQLCPVPESLFKHPETLTGSQWNCFLCSAEKRLSNDVLAGLKSLTLAEAKVFLLLALSETSNKHLANILKIGVRTVETHRAHVFKKLKLYSIENLRDLLAKSVRGRV